MVNTLHWMTAGVTYPRPASGNGAKEIGLWVNCANGGTAGNGLVQFGVTGEATTKGVKILKDEFAQIISTNGIYLAHAIISIPDTVTDGDTFTLTATPLNSDLSSDGTPIALGPCKSMVFDETTTGQNVLSVQHFAKTPGDPTKPGNHYQIFLNVKTPAGGAIAGAAAEIILDPPGTSKLYLDDDTATEASSYLPGVYYINSNASGRVQARLATNPGVRIQVVTVTGNVVGMKSNPSAHFYFSRTSDTADQSPGWLPPTLPDADSNGYLHLQHDQKTFRLTVPINDPYATPAHRGVIINDDFAFLVHASTTTTVREAVTHLVIGGGTVSNWFTVFSQDHNGAIECSGASGYGVKNAPGANLPDQDAGPRVLPEALIDPDPANRVLTKNHINAHDGIAIALNPIIISSMGLSDNGNNFDPSLPASATTVVFGYYMNGYESSASIAVKSRRFSNFDMHTPLPGLTLATDNAALEWSQPYAVLKYAHSVGWYQNSSAVPPRQPCGFDYYIEQVQNGVANRWYSSLTSQIQLPYTANIPA
ncbi:hypothetical protein GCM10011491_44760 [Brucella endophytica]|uniref:Uncharacterized protein n=1 Tax=Brucella endophytica TaxID=1963359 RepID=A0A916WMF3_9HYPH|nr:hypothetical protein [Brucella endophytica]GGB11908.1 hypothetical protein GCM10011491_44760 [Brucella endophytica]